MQTKALETLNYIFEYILLAFKEFAYHLNVKTEFILNILAYAKLC